MSIDFDKTPSWRRYLRFWGRDFRADVDAELDFHIQSRIDEMIAAGFSPDDARRAAHSRFGDVQTITESCRALSAERERSMQRARWYSEIQQDARIAVRQLWRTPAFSIIALLTIALGIGANTTIFSALDSLLLRPLPYDEPSQLVTIDQYYPTREDPGSVISPAGLRDFRAKSRTISAIGVTSEGSLNLIGFGEPQRIPAVNASASYFDVYRVKPVIGRVFTEQEDQPGVGRVVVISYGLWQRVFGGERSVLGRTINLHGLPNVIVGVMPAGFRDFWAPRTELWQPIALTAEQYADDPGNEWLRTVARTAPGASVQEAIDEYHRLGDEMKKDYPQNFGGDYTVAVTSLNEMAKGKLRPALLLLLGAVVLLLLIACANVANLLLVRASGRRRDLAIRAALGASRSQIARQLLIESSVLGGAGGAIGLIVSIWAVRGVNALAADRLGFASVRMDLRVLAFALGLSLLTVLLFGLLPALRASRAPAERTLRETARAVVSDRGGVRLQHALVVGELALALVLLVGAGLLLRSFRAVQTINPGFQPENILTLQVDLPPAQYESRESQVAFYDEALTRLRALPGVLSGATTSILAFSGEWATTAFFIENLQRKRGEPLPWGDIRIVSSDLNKALGVPLKAGRFFNDQDRANTQLVAVVDEVLANKYWPGQDPIGKRVRRTGGDPNAWITVVGVVAHTKHEALDANDRIQLYLPYRQHPVSSMSFLLRTTGEPMSLAAAARQTIWSVDRDQAITRVQRFSELVDASLTQRRFSTLLLALFAVLASLLAGLGIYGVMAHVVSQRTRELAVRAAMGATTMDVARHMLGQSLRVAMVGIAFGLVGAALLSRLLVTQLYGVQPGDPTTYITVTIGILLMTVASVAVPVLRATRVQPLTALTTD